MRENEREREREKGGGRGGVYRGREGEKYRGRLRHRGREKRVLRLIFPIACSSLRENPIIGSGATERGGGGGGGGGYIEREAGRKRKERRENEIEKERGCSHTWRKEHLL